MRTSEFKEMLLKDASKIIVDRIAKSVITSPELFDEIYSLTYDKDKKVAWRALWACKKICELKASFFADKYDELANRAMKEENAGMMRLMMNILCSLEQPKEINVEFLDFCINNMTSFNMTSACQAICMKLAYMMCCDNQPELLNEIRIIIENMDNNYYNPAAICARNNILKEIRKKSK